MEKGGDVQPGVFADLPQRHVSQDVRPGNKLAVGAGEQTALLIPLVTVVSFRIARVIRSDLLRF
jgi:hypothetical protein